MQTIEDKLFVINYRGTDLKIDDTKGNRKRVYYTLSAARQACKLLVKTIKLEAKRNPEYVSVYGNISLSMFEIIEYDLREKKRYLL